MRSFSPRWLVVALTLGVMVGCGSEQTDVQSAERNLEAVEAVAAEHGVEITTQGPVSLDPPITRPRRRMDIDQLNATIQDVTGGIAWTDPATGDNLFETLSATLGKPDYAQTTNENLATTALFQKFLNDAARHVCHELMNRELNNPAAEKILFAKVTPQDTYETAPEAVRANLRSLLLRFHGRHLTPGDPGIELWRWFFDSSEHVAETPAIAWRTVCAGLISHPDFYMY
jgi:hypothetical protein